MDLVVGNIPGALLRFSAGGAIRASLSQAGNWNFSSQVDMQSMVSMGNRLKVSGNTSGEAALIVDQKVPGHIAQFQRDGVSRVTIQENGTTRIAGHIRADGDGASIGSDYESGANDFWQIWMDGAPNDQGVLHIRSGDNANEPIYLEQHDFNGATHVRLAVGNNGHVGIGTTQPEKRLHVEGDAKVTGNLDVSGITTKVWTVAPDYVFEKDYKLAKLEQVEAFVTKNKHLPEVPSAKQLKEKGMDLVEMNLILLKKIEELTLHAIQQEKKIASLEKKFTATKAGAGR
jgi:hypothetical protein